MFCGQDIVRSYAQRGDRAWVPKLLQVFSYDVLWGCVSWILFRHHSRKPAKTHHSSSAGAFPTSTACTRDSIFDPSSPFSWRQIRSEKLLLPRDLLVLTAESFFNCALRVVVSCLWRSTCVRCVWDMQLQFQRHPSRLMGSLSPGDEVMIWGSEPSLTSQQGHPGDSHSLGVIALIALY